MTTCGCGAQLAHEAHIACNDCMAKVPKKIREEYFDRCRYKRGAPSYHSARRAVLAELGQIHAAARGDGSGAA